MGLLNKIFEKNKNLAWRIIDGEAVVIPLEDQLEEEKLNILNETATRIWELIDGKNSLKEIIQRLTEEYDIKSTDASAQVRDLIGNLFRKKLIIMH